MDGGGFDGYVENAIISAYERYVEIEKIMNTEEAND